MRRQLFGWLAVGLIFGLALGLPMGLAQSRQQTTDDAEQRPPPFFGQDPQDTRAASRARVAFRKQHKKHPTRLETWHMLGELGHFDQRGTAELALDELDCEEVEHHAQARRLIAGFAGVDTLEVVLEEGLDHKKAHVRTQTILALGAGRPDVVDWITPTEAGLDDESAAVRAAAVESLGLARAEGRLDRILELVDDASPRVRQQLPSALVRLVHDRSIPLLRSLAEDSSWRVRAAVVRAYGQLGNKQAAEELVAMLEQEDGRVKEDAHHELAALAQVDFGPDADAWRKYFLNHDPGVGPEPKPARGRAEPGGTTVAKLSNETYFDIPVLSRKLVLVIDVSGSMDALEQPLGNDAPDAEPLSRHDLTKRELQRLLLGFGPEVSLELVHFSDDARSWKGKLVPMATGPRAAASKQLEQFHPSGGTHLRAALTVCFDMAQESLDDATLEDETPDTIYVLTDGQPANPTQLLLEYVAERNRELQLRMHCVCLISDDKATQFMRDLAELTRGEYVNPLE